LRESIEARWWPALPAIGVAVFLLLRLAFDHGGYFPAAFTSAAAVGFLALAVLVLRPAEMRLSLPALAGVGALAAFAVWSGLSRAWSTVPDAPLLDMQRAMLYLALFGLALIASDSVRNTRLLVWSVLATIIVITGAGLLSRLQPDIVASSSEPFFAGLYRLDHPLQYWNAFGTLAAMGAVLATGLAADARARTALRAATAGATVLLLVAMYLSLSRGAWLALVAGVVVLLVAAPRRGSLLLTLAVTGAVATLAILRVRGYPALVDDPTAGRGAASEGDAYTWQLIGLVLLAAGAQAALARAGKAFLAAQRLQTIRRFALIAGGVLLVSAAIISYLARGDEAEGGVNAAFHDTSRWLDRQWQDFLDPTTVPGVGAARLTSAKGSRSDAYRIAIDGFEAQPLIGEGAGSYEVRHARERTIDEKVRDAHSLPLQTLSELGAVGILLLLAFFAAVAAAARRALAGKGAMRPAEAAAVLAACVVWLAHACVDWDWEMPGLTGPAFVLSATLFQRGRRRRSRRRGSPASS
jgi:O-antigen ligase